MASSVDNPETVLIVGAGPGLSASFARLCRADGMDIHLASRDTKKLDPLAAEIGATVHACDATKPEDVVALFDAMPIDPDIVLYNPSRRISGDFTSLDPQAVEEAIRITCYGGFLVAQAAAKRMEARGHGTILLTGASASIKGYARSAAFAMGKFGLRGLAQSLARELQPKGIHVAHFVIDGQIAPEGQEAEDGSKLAARAIAETYLATHRQDRSAWTWEIELRPWTERF